LQLGVVVGLTLDPPFEMARVIKHHHQFAAAVPLSEWMVCKPLH